MLGIKLICVGKMKESYFIEAVREYEKRLSSYCKLEIDELREMPLSQNPSAAELDAALDREASLILPLIPKGTRSVALCVEGKMLDSEGFSAWLQDAMGCGDSRLCFIIGGSFGLHKRVKALAGARLSMSAMTLPHHLARVMLLEQIYRGFKILEGSRYHK